MQFENPDSLSISERCVASSPNVIGNAVIAMPKTQPYESDYNTGG